MKTPTSAALSLLILTQLLAATPAFAIFGIPGTPSIPGDPGDTARAIERSVKCNQIRDDANHHQAELRQAIAETQAHLNSTNATVSENASSKQKIVAAEDQLAQYDALIATFKDANTGLILSSAEIKSLLMELHARENDPEFVALVTQLESQTNNPSLQKFAKLIHTLLAKNKADLQATLSNKNSHDLLQQMAQLIGSSEVLITQQKATNAALLTDCDNQAARLSQEQANLTAKINQLNSEWNSQEERKSCNF